MYVKNVHKVWTGCTPNLREQLLHGKVRNEDEKRTGNFVRRTSSLNKLTNKIKFYYKKKRRRKYKMSAFVHLGGWLMEVG